MSSRWSLMWKITLFAPRPQDVREQDAYLQPLPTRVAKSLRSLLDAEKRQHFGGITTRFYTASAILILEHLHAEMPALGGVLCRDLSPDAFVVTVDGTLQLLDLRYAVPADPAPRHNFVGFAHYQAPEVLAGESYEKPADYWGLGAFTYELATGSSPWLTETRSRTPSLPFMSAFALTNGTSSGFLPRCTSAQS